MGIHSSSRILKHKDEAVDKAKDKGAIDELRDLDHETAETVLDLAPISTPQAPVAAVESDGLERPAARTELSSS